MSRPGSRARPQPSPPRPLNYGDGVIILNRKTLAEVERDAAKAMRAGRRDKVKRAPSPRKPRKPRAPKEVSRKPKTMVDAGLICRESFSRGPCAELCCECANFQVPQPKKGARHAGK